MKPYYDEDGITIFHGECEDKKADVIVLDPPYFLENVNEYQAPVKFIFAGSRHKDYRERTGGYNYPWGRIIPSADDSPKYNKHFELLYRGNLYIDAIVIVGDIPEPPLRAYSVQADGLLHQWQRPLALLFDLLRLTGGDVLDPFCGSGTTLVAAKMLGRKATGYDTEVSCCEIAAKRCREVKE